MGKIDLAVAVATATTTATAMATASLAHRKCHGDMDQDPKTAKLMGFSHHLSVGAKIDAKAVSSD
jgi:hypothetical protein